MDTAEQDAFRTTVTRRRLGGIVEEVAVSNGGTEQHTIASAGDDERIILPPSAPSRSRRKRRRRPLYRRPLIVAPIALLLVVLGIVAVIGYRAESLIASLHIISTPPPVITDATFREDGDPDMPGRPITVDTGPAREALASTGTMERFPNAGTDGGSSRLQQAVSNSGDLVGGAAVAAGLTDQNMVPITLLVMGVDAQPGEAIDIGVRPDALMVVRLDPQSGSCRVLSIPRDTRVELPGYGESKINHALMVGGIPYQLLVTEDFLDLPIDHYILVDFVAFEQMVDAVGGISVEIPEDLAKNGEVRYRAGTQDFDGEQALAYVRFRNTATEGDPGRVQRQWGVLAGLMDVARERNLVRDVNTMLPTLESHLRTDLSATELAEIAGDFGNDCISGNSRSIAMLQGNRVRLPDPIIGETLYFEVVEEETVQRQVERLLEHVPVEPAATPVPPAIGAPVPDPRTGGRTNDRL